MSNQQPKQHSRREFLKQVATAAVATSVTGGAAQAAQTEPFEQPENTNKLQTKYRETQHVKDYYDSL